MSGCQRRNFYEKELWDGEKEILASPHREPLNVSLSARVLKPWPVAQSEVRGQSASFDLSDTSCP